MKKSLSLIELNEVNFDVVRSYLKEQPGRYQGFERLLQLDNYTTFSESNYELLEPWIQWTSVHTKKTYAEHKIFRLGDIINLKCAQIFEKVESLGFVVGCLSPMNALNKLDKPSFFIPDPWTDTEPDQSFISKNLHSALRQAVNDNSQEKLSFRTITALLFGFILYSRKKNIFLYMSLFLKRKKRWNKALFLDLFLSDLYTQFFVKRPTDFGTLFLNAFAHIQHHYFLNSKFTQMQRKNSYEYISENDDPIKEAIQVYDLIIRQLLEIKCDKKVFATGLRQLPVTKPVVYYRLKNHALFLNKCGVRNFSVEPRMTRDFKLTFENNTSQREAEEILSKLSCNGEKLFGIVDHRSDSTFCTLTYSSDLSENSIIEIDNNIIPLAEHFIFVALKNGNHDSKGYLFTDMDTTVFGINDSEQHVSCIGVEIENYFT